MEVSGAVTQSALSASRPPQFTLGGESFSLIFGKNQSQVGYCPAEYCSISFESNLAFDQNKLPASWDLRGSDHEGDKSNLELGGEIDQSGEVSSTSETRLQAIRSLAFFSNSTEANQGSRHATLRTSLQSPDYLKAQTEEKENSKPSDNLSKEKMPEIEVSQTFKNLVILRKNSDTLVKDSPGISHLSVDSPSPTTSPLREFEVITFRSSSLYFVHNRVNSLSDDDKSVPFFDVSNRVNRLPIIQGSQTSSFKSSKESDSHESFNKSFQSQINKFGSNIQLSTLDQVSRDHSELVFSQAASRPHRDEANKDNLPTASLGRPPNFREISEKMNLSSVSSQEKTDDVLEFNLYETPRAKLQAGNVLLAKVLTTSLIGQSMHTTEPMERKERPNSVSISVQVSAENLEINLSSGQRELSDLLSRHQNDLKGSLRKMGVEEFNLSFARDRDSSSGSSTARSSKEPEDSVLTSLSEVHAPVATRVAVSGVDLLV